MELKNGYKVIYDKAAGGEHVFYASKTGVFADAEEIVKVAAGEYKLIYEKAGQVYGSKTGIPAEGDYCFTEFAAVFEAAEEEIEDEIVETPETPAGEEENGTEGTENGPTYDLPTIEEEDEE